MGVINSNRNRQSTQSKTPNRISFSALSRFAASLVSSYPNYTKSIVSRKPHAPVRNLKLSYKRKFQQQTTPSLKMGNCFGADLFKRYDRSKKDALGYIKHHEHVDNEVIDLEDGDGDEVMRGISDDSGIEELDVKDDRMDSRMLDCEDDVFVEPVFKRLHQSANKRDSKINDLRLNIEELEKRREGLHGEGLWRRIKGKKDLVEECFTHLTDEEESDVAEAFSICKRRTLVVSHESSNIDIIGEKFQCLRPGGWLNDEVINVYLALLKEREKREPEKFLKCHFFNTFFYNKLIGGRGGYSYQSVQRWTTQKKLGYSLLECDKIFVPIHRTNHWCLAIINKKERKIQYLDSFKGVDARVLDVLARYYVDEVKDKSGKEVDVSSWELEHVEDLPEQMNGYDCGMFMIKYADFYSRNLGLCFSQEHMPYFRKRTAKELLSLRAD